MPTLAHSELTAAFNTAFAALLRDAVARLGYDEGQNIPGQVYLRADAAYRTFDPKSNSPDLRARQAVRWLTKIQRNLIIDIIRAATAQKKNARTESLDRMSEVVSDEGESFAELCWAAVQAEKDRDEARRADMLTEARLRVKYATLSEEERNCLFWKLQGRKLKEIAAQTELSTASVWRRIESAIAALQAVDIEPFASPDLEKYQWKHAGTVTLYRAPTTTGSCLNRERLASWDKNAFRAA